MEEDDLPDEMLRFIFSAGPLKRAEILLYFYQSFPVKVVLDTLEELLKTKQVETRGNFIARPKKIGHMKNKKIQKPYLKGNYMDENFYNKVTVIILIGSLIGILVLTRIGINFRAKLDSTPKPTCSTTQYKI